MTSLSTYDMSTLYTTLSHNLIKEKFLDLIERAFKNTFKNKTKVRFILPGTIGKRFSLLQTIEGVNFGIV